MPSRFSILTRPAIRALTEGSKLTEHGIIAERTVKGDVRWSIAIMVDGRRIHKVIGVESEGVTREQCERAIEGFRSKAREGRLDLPVGRKTHPLFGEQARAYLKRLGSKPNQWVDAGRIS